VAEGALEATRSDYARLQSEISAERSMRRRSISPEQTFDADKAKEARPSKNGNGAGHGVGNGEPPAAPPHSGAA
ncbi:MAG TPA: hypothetical protein VK749_16615, partial [Xanthobacteraceae bacterium]|nr:hypothetical protein [Xanthobacteraceae bacterium]